MKNKVFYAMILTIGFAFVSLETSKMFSLTMQNTTNMKDTTVKYTCPHHPDVVSNKPGKCTCGADLVMVKNSGKMSKSHKMKKDGMKKGSKGMMKEKMEMKKDSTMMKKDDM